VPRALRLFSYLALFLQGCLPEEDEMTYTIAEYHEGIHIVRAELHNKEDFDQLIKQLLTYRNQHYPQKEENK
jgi:hypothetical protein